jgi:predicted metal-dependent HD superfamily phosphohydrolase
MNRLFISSWSRAWSGLHAQGDAVALRNALLARYAEPHRKYHTLQHLEECLALFDTMAQTPENPAEVEMALWFHDAIYELRSSNNEGLSAAWAYKELLAAGVSLVSAELVRDLVLVTKHSGMPSNRDEQVLVDIDLSILGAPDERFAEYERQIREEYSYVPSFLFTLKRKAILGSFLDRSAIYTTPALHQRLEAQARHNIARALQ